MEVDEALYRLFLEEMRGIDELRITYSGRHPGVPLDRGDQDVQRLIEALAILSARTRRAAERTLEQSTRRLLSQHFPYLTAPVPALAMLEAEVDKRFVDPAEVGVGEELAVEDATFRALRPLRLLPLRLVEVVHDPGRPSHGAEIFLRFDAGHRRRWSVGALILYVDHLSDLGSSATVYHALQESLLGVEVSWGTGPTAGDQRSRCAVIFGPLDAGPRRPDVVHHPLQEARFFFRLPEQDLSVGFGLPPPPGEWSTFTLCLRLSEAWPRGLSLPADTFRLHAVPAINLRKDMAAPIEHDGARSADVVIHPDPGASYRLHSVQGVYRLDPKDGLVPLLPGFVPEAPRRAAGDALWEVDVAGLGDRRQGRLRIVAPGAFESPLRVSVEAHWHQPGRAFAIPDGAAARLVDRFLEGVSMSVRGRVLPAEDAELEGDQEALLSLLAARSRRTLRLEDIHLLLRVLRGPSDRAFSNLVQALTGVEVRAVPSAVAASGFRYDYWLRFEDVRATEVPMLHLLARRLREVLAVWSTEEVVGLMVELPHLDRVLEYREEERWR